MLVEFLEILRDIKISIIFEERFDLVWRILVWAEKSKNENLKLKAVNFLKNQKEEDYESVIREINKIKKKYTSKKVFVVHGHNLSFRNKVVEILESEGFDCFFVSTSNLFPDANILTKVLTNMKDSLFVVVIASADDVGRSAKEDTELFPKPRLNVVFEFGIALGLFKLGQIILLWDARLGLQEVSDYAGYLRIVYGRGRAWRNDFRENLVTFKALVSNYIK